MRIDEHVPLASLTTFKLGGPARFVVTIDSEDELAEVAAFAEEKKLPILPLGAGSNILAHDGAHDVVFVRIGLSDIKVEGEKVFAEAGATWDDVIQKAVEADLWGIENLSAIPGTVGGAVYQNIGAYGAALSDVLDSVCAYDLQEKKVKTFSKSECRFGYRTSLFKEVQDRFIILSAQFVLSADARPNLDYKDLKLRFVGMDKPLLADIQSAVVKIRAQKFPPLSVYGTAGSFFLNPVMDKASAERIRLAYPAMPLFDLPEGGVKVPLAWFLEHVVKVKGMRDGFVHVWRDHSLVIVADTGATARDVSQLAEKIISLTQDAIGIKIVSEVRFL